MNRMRKGVRSGEAPQPSGHYQQAVIWDDVMYLSGQGPADARTGAAPDGIEARVLAALRNLEAVLRAAGSDKRHVLRCGVFLESMKDFDAMNRVYAEFFGPNPPARTTVEAGLGGIGVEIDMIAAIARKPARSAPAPRPRPKGSSSASKQSR